MTRTLCRTIAPTKRERVERNAQKLLHEIYASGSSEQIEAITGTLGIFVEVIRSRRKASDIPRPKGGVVIDFIFEGAGETAHFVSRRRSVQQGATE